MTYVILETYQAMLWFSLAKLNFTKGRIIQHGRDLETWHLEAGGHLGTSEADTEVGAL